MQSLLIKPPEVRHCGTLWDIVEKHTSIVRLTSLLVVTLPKFTLKSFLLSLTHVNHTHFSAMQADTSKKVTVTWLLRCKHYMVIASSQAGQV